MRFIVFIIAVFNSFFAFSQTVDPFLILPYDYSAFTKKTVDFSPDGKLIAFGTNDGHVKVFDIQQRRELINYKAHTDMTICVRFKSDSKTIVSASKDGFVYSFDFVEKKEFWNVKVLKKAILALEFSLDEAKIFCGGRDNAIKILEMNTGKELLMINDVTGNIFAIKNDPIGNSIIVATNAISYGIRIYSTIDGEETRLLESSNTEMISISSDSSYLVSANLNKLLFVWDLKLYSFAFSLEGHKKWCSSVVFSPNGKTFASSSQDGTIIIWDIKQKTQIQSFKAHSQKITALSFSKDGRMLVSASWDGTVKLWNAKPFMRY